MSWRKGKSSGWTAFDLKQRQKQGLESEIEEDPFPPVSSSFNTALDVRGKLTRNHVSSEKSFSSVLLPPSKFPALTENNKDCGNQVSCGGHDSTFMKLKEMFSWADDSLIRDILLSTEDNFEMAFGFLEGMASAGNAADKGTNNKKPKVRMAARSTCEDAGKYDLQESSGSSFLVNAYDSEKLSDDISELDSIIQRLQSIPIEPEWEEDDLYLSHRKDALKMMRYTKACILFMLSCLSFMWLVNLSLDRFCLLNNPEFT